MLWFCLLSPPIDSNVQPRSTAGHSPCDLIYPHGLVDCKRMTPNLLPIYPDFSTRCLLEISTWVSYRHLSHVKNEINNGFPPTILLLLNHSHFPTSSFFPLPRLAKQLRFNYFMRNCGRERTGLGTRGVELYTEPGSSC